MVIHDFSLKIYIKTKSFMTAGRVRSVTSAAGLRRHRPCLYNIQNRIDYPELVSEGRIQVAATLGDKGGN